VIGVLAVVLWVFVAPALIRRELSVHLAGLAGTSNWSLNWKHRGQDVAHGVWLDLSHREQSVLEIEPSGVAAKAGTFEFLMYSVTSDEGITPDLKALIASPSPDVSPGWSPRDQGPGMVYAGNTPGRLRLPLPCRVATITYGKTERGGEVTLRCRGETVKLDTYAPATASETVTVPSTSSLPESSDFSQALPMYTLSELTLRWRAPAGSELVPGKAVVRFSLLGFELFERTPELQAGSDVAPGAESRWKVVGPDPSLRLIASLRLGAPIFIAGVLATYAWIGAFWLMAKWLAARASSIVHARATGVIVVAAIVLVVNLGLGWKAPLFVTPDGLDYIDAAHGLATTGTFDRFPDYKAPGLSVLLAGAILVSDNALDVFGWFEAGLGVLSALMAYSFVRARASHNWALVAALLVGVHPTLLTYSCYLLREGPSAAVVLAVGLVMIKLTDHLRDRGRGGWVLTFLLGALCAAGAYLRENMQMLLLFVPLTLLLTPWRLAFWARAARAAAVVLVAGALLSPRVMQIYRTWGTIGVVCPKAQVNRALAAWNNELSDGNDTAFFSEEQWDKLRRSESPWRISDYEFIGQAVNSQGALHRAGLDQPRDPSEPQVYVNSEAESKLWVNEAIARAPLDAAWDSLIAFVNQLGLWNIHTNAASNNEWYARPLRGEEWPFTTNFIFDASEANWPDRLKTEQDRLRPIMNRSRRNTADLAGSPVLRLFNEWFLTFRAVGPFFAALFLAGIVLAVRRKDIALAGAAGVALLSILAAAIVVAAPTDRFGVPFIPIVVCMAVYTLASWWEWRGKRGVQSVG
jgi:hypothetical protein